MNKKPPPDDAPSDDAPGAAVTAAALTVTRGSRTVLDDLHFTVETGRVTGLLGPSGCGKTTLMRALAAPRPRSPAPSTSSATRPATPACATASATSPRRRPSTTT